MTSGVFELNYCRPFIFSTAMPMHSLAAIKVAYYYFPMLTDRRERLKQLQHTLKENFQSTNEINLLPSQSPIQSIMIQGNSEVKYIAELLQKKGYDARAILSPTVAKGKERIRICLHSHNTEEEVRALTQSLYNISLSHKQTIAQ
jgi:8-amino-7-oxononanoate synthase